MKLPQLWRLFSLCVLAAATLPHPAPAQTSFAYVVNNFETAESSSSAIWMYRVDRSTGLFTPSGTVPFGVGVSPLNMALDPHNKFLYVANSFSLSAYAIDPIAGTLSPLPGSPFSAQFPRAVAVHPSGKFLYVAEGTDDVALYSLNAAGIPTFITRTPASGGPFALTIDPSGKFLYTANLLANTASFYIIDKNSGALTLTAQVSTGLLPGSVALTPSGHFLFVPNENGQSVSVYSIDSNSGVPTPVPGSPFATGVVPRAAVVDPSGNFVYVVSSGSGTISAFTIDNTGQLSPLLGSPFAVPPPGSAPVAVSMDSSGKWLYVLSVLGSVSTFAIDNSGALTLQGSTAAGTAGTNTLSMLVTK